MTHEERLYALVERAARRDRKVGRGTEYDLCMTVARIVWREAVRHTRRSRPRKGNQ